MCEETNHVGSVTKVNPFSATARRCKYRRFNRCAKPLSMSVTDGKLTFYGGITSLPAVKLSGDFYRIVIFLHKSVANEGGQRYLTPDKDAPPQHEGA